jgi:hypothetical protein
MIATKQPLPRKSPSYLHLAVAPAPALCLVLCRAPAESAYGIPEPGSDLGEE